ncbi:hypothetical protein MNBD_NITROSPINAE02-2154 [hydrothermal vent metagenome]|uniref:Lipoprotein n=1 Tax=hydrothermal vent metagenome TaxID=652676 RepID=A0A3B1C130_9ZZZZ
MNRSAPMSLSFVVAIALAIFTSGCASRYLTPLGTWGAYRAGAYYKVKDRGVSLSIQPIAWSPGARNLEGRLLPLKILVGNKTGKPISVRRSDFGLTDQWRMRRRQWEQAGYWFNFGGHGFNFHYYGVSPFPFFFWWGGLYYDGYDVNNNDRSNYARWDSSMAIDEKSLLPEGELGPGDTFGGVLLFHVDDSQNQVYILRWNPGGARAPLMIMFRVETA